MSYPSSGVADGMELFPLDIIRKAWGPDTAYGGAYDPNRPSVGHCAVTALVVQDVLGGEILRTRITGLGSHYWNLIPAMGEIDLTREQYHRDLVIPRGEVVARSYLLEGQRAIEAGTEVRYQNLRRNIYNACGRWS